MLRRILKAAAIGAGGLVVVGAVLYQFFGLRVVLDGGGTPHLRFVESAKARAEQIAHHREAQRSQAELRAPAADTPAPAPPDHALPDAVAVVVSSAAALAAGPAPYWTDFRGPARDGHYRERPILTDWPARGLTPIWKQPVGGGYASFVIARGRAFTIEQRAAEEVVAAYDIRTGRELWTNAWPALFQEFMGGDGPRATPTWAGGRVYALGAKGEFRALDDATGRILWRTNILDDNGATNLQWGMAASPLVIDDTVVVLPGGSNGRSMGLTPDRGELLWEYPWRTEFDINAAQPLVVGDNRVFLSSSYGTGAAVIEVAARGTGFSVREVWRNIRMKNRFAGSVLHEGFVYGLDESILACVDAATGDLKWKAGRYGYGQLLLASGHLIVLTEDGDLALVRATPDRHEEIVRFSVLNGKTWNPPALAGGYLLVRNLAEMAAFDLRLPAE